MRVLIDTSAWIEYLRATGSAAAVEVRRLLTSDTEIVVCEPIAMEILSGAVRADSYAKLQRLVDGLPSLKLDDTIDFRSAAAIFRNARLSIRNVNDCLIAALAIRHDVELVHSDADYDVIAGITPLKARRLR